MKQYRRAVKPVLGALLGACFALNGPVLAQISGPVAVETFSFGEDSFAIGSLSRAEGALPRDLWRGATAEDVSFLLDNLPRHYADPAWLDVMRRVLLSPGEGPAGADTALTGQKVMVLARAGFYDEAAGLAELTGGLQSEPELSQAIAYADMLRGDMAAACGRGARLQSGRSTDFWLKLRTLCYVVSDEMAAAELTLGLLRERDLLSDREDALFVAMTTGVKPSGEFAPRTGFEYAAVRHLELPVPVDQLDQADGAVLRALANEPRAPKQARVYAAERALYFGFMDAEEGAAIFRSLSFTPEEIASAGDALRSDPSNYLTDALVFQAVDQMTSLEATLDRTALVGEALRAAGSLQRFTALAKLYAPVTRNLEVIVNYAPYAEEFALAGILAGDPDLAERWITALAQDQTDPDGQGRAQAMLNLMAIRDTEAAERAAPYAGLETPEVGEVDPDNVIEAYTDQNVSVPRLVEIALRPGAAQSDGLNALLALSALPAASDGEVNKIRQMVLNAGLDRSGLGRKLVDELAFHDAAEKFVSNFHARRRADGGVAAEPDAAGAGRPVTGGAARIVPRIKPDIANG